MAIAGSLIFSLAFIEGAFSQEDGQDSPSHISIGCLHPKDLEEMLALAQRAERKKTHCIHEKKCNTNKEDKAWKKKLDTVCSMIDLNALEYVRTLAEVKVNDTTFYINEFFVGGFPQAKVYAYTTHLPSWIFDI